MRATLLVSAGMVFAGLAASASGEFSLRQQGKQIVVVGSHFRVTVDTAKGGEITNVELFDGSQWNRFLGGDGQTCPALKLSTEADEYSLGNDAVARIENVQTSDEVVRFHTVGNPRAASGKASPWTVRLSYQIYPEGGLFVDVDCRLKAQKTELTAASISLTVDRAITKAAKCRHVFRRLDPVNPKEFPSARVAFGLNPQRSFTNEVEAIVEYGAAMAGKTSFKESNGRATWMLADGKSLLRAPLHYHNRFSMALGSGTKGMGKPDTNLVASRGYDWFRSNSDPKFLNPKENSLEKPPSDEEIDRMSAKGATFVQLQTWFQGGRHNGHPHDLYKPWIENDLIRAITHAHDKGLRVSFYIRGIERYCLDRPFLEKHLKRDWDGIYVDWHGAHCVALHEYSWRAEPALGDVHFSADGSYVPAWEYFLFCKRLRQLVGQRGILIGHLGFGKSGIMANLCFDGYLPGETPSDHKMFSSRDEAVFVGMTGGGLCTPYPLSRSFRTPEAIAKMAAWGLYPIASLGVVDEILATSGNPDDPGNAYHLGYWRILAAIDADRATVYNLPSVNQIAATCSQPNFSCVVYREESKSRDPADAVFLVVVANLGATTAQSRIALAPSVLGMSGEYELARVAPESGLITLQGATTGKWTTTALPSWGFEGYKLVRKK
jgi:hypothetical protein